MGRVDDEKLVLHIRERLVVHNLFKEALFGPGGQPLDRGCPGVERGGVEGIGEEVRVVSCHRCIQADRWKEVNALTACRPNTVSGLFKVNTRSFRV